jgi:hypothetical protein
VTVADAWTPNLEPLPTCAGFAVLSGFLSVADPYFVGLTVVLAAFTLSLWIAEGSRRHRGTRTGPKAIRAVAGSGLLLALWAIVFGDPRLLGEWGGVCLGAASGVLWWTARRSGRGAP